MYKRILAFMIAFMLAVILPVSAFAEETEETTAETNDSTEGTYATGESTATEVTDETISYQGNENTEPTGTTVETEPIQPSNPTNPTEPAGSLIPTTLEIDTENVYEGMDKAYEDGYVPKVQDGFVYLVLPLLSNGDIYENEIKVSLNLGSSASSPFEIANYVKNFSLEKIKPKDSEKEMELFLVEFEIKLSSARVNGVYPVVVNVSGYDDSGSTISCIYTLYVTITDGKSNEPQKTYVETPTAEPVVFISNSVMEPQKAMAGEDFTLTLTLKNSVATKSVKNMMVKVDTGNLHINLLEDTNTFQIDKIAADGETKLTLHFDTDPSIQAGKYTLQFSFKYDSNKTLNLSSSSTAIIEILQPTNMELVLPRFPESVTVGETIPLSLQVMNMGRDRVRNVRCVVSGSGFAPANTGYIGTMEAGTTARTEVELYIMALNTSGDNKDGNQYGNTVGTITLIYEDESGQEFSQEVQFETAVKRPVVQITPADTTEEKEEENTRQWWVSVVILGGVICAAGITIIIIKHKSKGHVGKYL